MTAEAKANILLVDDRPDSLLALEAILAELGQNLVKADSGRQALRCVLEQDFAVILLDVHMPGMDGFETASLIRERERSKHTPIVFLTASDPSELAVFRGYSVGAVDYLVKPFAPGILKSKVAVFVDLFQMREKARQQTEQLAAINQNLERENAERKRAEEELRRSHDELERRVQERTAELAKANEALQAELAERERMEKEKTNIEQQLRQAHKMEAIGKLAGGVAHDFNNLVTIITGYSDMLLSRIGPENSTRRELEQIKKAGDRAHSLTRQLLAFSRRQMLQPKVLDLNAVVTNLEPMLQRLIGENIELVIELKPGLGQVKADPGQIEQVIMNLAINARDAMLQGGKLLLQTDNIELDEAYALRHIPTQPGSYVHLAVSDTGCGMDAATQSRIFEPFFTTKEQGKGTGLGLSTVYGIVKQSGGYIWVYSEHGQGTTFKIYLPRVLAPADSVPPVTHWSSLPQGKETVLLVEDEPEVRWLVRDMLQHLGYTVLEARHGIEAQVLSIQHAGPIHLLITDVVMPQMSGREIAEQLTSEHPETKVLYMSGYTDDAVVRHGVLAAEIAFLQKPFTPEAMARKVREVLDGQTSGSGKREVRGH